MNQLLKSALTTMTATDLQQFVPFTFLDRTNKQNVVIVKTSGSYFVQMTNGSPIRWTRTSIRNAIAEDNQVISTLPRKRTPAPIVLSPKQIRLNEIDGEISDLDAQILKLRSQVSTLQSEKDNLKNQANFVVRRITPSDFANRNPLTKTELENLYETDLTNGKLTTNKNNVKDEYKVILHNVNFDGTRFLISKGKNKNIDVRCTELFVIIQEKD